MHYENILETVEDVDGMLTYKSQQLKDLIPRQRSIVNEQIDTLLDLRNFLAQTALGDAE